MKLALLLLPLVAMATGVTCQKPNIVIMLADDVGWADVERHDPEMRTPNVERLAQRGMFLNQSYVQPTCAPTRSALLTGRWPYTYGMQVNQIKGARLAWLDENLKLFPATLKELGYTTHMIGKWHLGFCNRALLPTSRGFDTFYGFYSGAQGYFNHSGDSPHAYDFRDNDEVVWSARGHYSTELHTARAQRIIREHGDHHRPFFLYMAYQNAHAPFEAPQSYVDRYCSHVQNETRRIHCAMVAAMDESIGNITDTLEAEGYTNNTIILFLSDNGGPTVGGSSNYPLRGQKASLWEGGTRSFTLLAGPTLRHSNVTYDGLIHAVDWYPTLVQAAGGAPPRGLDGQAMWSSLQIRGPSLRNKMIYNIDDKHRRSALRWGQWKLLKGQPASKKLGWYPPASLLERGIPWEEVPRRRVPRWQLFDIQADPEERHNVYRNRRNRRVVRLLKRDLRRYTRKLRPYVEAPRSDRGNPRWTGGVYSPGWCDL
ncbi:hypothetical protein BaRGS_00039675 [Batillaria attramentaria]|uniref:Sulfatase N-terminal domain-containing protein n=1 Tax=Batillaria attramentaria TaxID=370345 RepID=A0ABD0J318_9CAEN